MFSCDVTDEAARKQLLEQVADTGLQTDVLVNNAGFGTAGPFAELDGDREVQMVRTNVEAVVALTHGVAPAMIERGRGAILTVASSAGFQPIPNQATYAASKAFALSLSEALSSELGEMGSRSRLFVPVRCAASSWRLRRWRTRPPRRRTSYG